MNQYEVVTTQVSGNRARVIHEFFADYDTAMVYADEICLYDNRTVKCSLYHGNLLVMDIL